MIMSVKHKNIGQIHSWNFLTQGLINPLSGCLGQVNFFAGQVEDMYFFVLAPENVLAI